MKSIFLTVVVICALTVSALGGTFAYLTDTEESVDNYIEIGSLDLKVNGEDDKDWGNGIGVIYEEECVVPGTFLSPRLIPVENEGCVDGYLYIVIKNQNCYNTEKEGAEGWIEDPQSNDDLKPEPEMVTEHGGWLAQVQLPGIGILGDNCSVGKHSYFTGVFSQYPLMPVGGGTKFIDDQQFGTLNEVVKYVGVLPACGGKWYLHFYYEILQKAEDDAPYDYDYFDDASPFNDWPANGLMADGIEFDIMFMLFDHMLTDDEIDAIEDDL
jgi:predicted ribosomally synthesized peptide with SipW-like signal peptide